MNFSAFDQGFFYMLCCTEADVSLMSALKAPVLLFV